MFAQAKTNRERQTFARHTEKAWARGDVGQSAYSREIHGKTQHDGYGAQNAAQPSELHQ
jgi:hypothetical protein